MKKICILFLTVFILLFSACSGGAGAKQPGEDKSGAKQPGEDKSGAKQPGKTEDEEGYYVIETSDLGMTRTFSELGVLQSRLGDSGHSGVCYFFDPVSGKEVPLCAKTNCTHQGDSWANPHPDCDAWLGGFMGFAGIVGDSLYYVCADSENYLRKMICRADPDGTNRKVLEVMDNVGFIQPGGAFYQNGYLIYEYYTDTAEDGTKLDKRLSRICIYDLERNEAEYIIGPENYGAQNYSAATVNATVVDHCLYYCYYYDTEDFRKISYEDLSDEKYMEYLDSIARMEIWAYDLDTKEKRLVMQESGRLGYSAGFGYAYTYTTNGKPGARLINLRTGESRELENPERLFEQKGTEVIEEGVLFYGDGSIDLWEFETGEVKHIGSYDKNLRITVEYVGRDWVYGLRYDDGHGPAEIFYLPKEQFMKGDMEWKYLPQEEP